MLSAWQVLLAVVRLPQYKTDLLVTLNSLVLVAQSNVAPNLASGKARAERKFDGINFEAPDLFRAMLSSLDIRDYALFGT